MELLSCRYIKELPLLAVHSVNEIADAQNDSGDVLVFSSAGSFNLFLDRLRRCSKQNESLPLDV